MARPVKFQESLLRLIKERGYERERKKLCSRVGITTAALSQYLGGSSNPSMEKLIKLADALDVTLDELVHGEALMQLSSEPLDYGPLARYVDSSLSRVQQQIAAQAALVSRIGSIVTDSIAQAATQLATETTRPFAGMTSDDETLALELYSTDTLIATLNFQYDISVIDGEAQAGRFLPTVQENLSRQRRYRFLLPPGRDWRPSVEAMRMLLSESLSSSMVRNNCKFAVTKEPFYVGFGLYTLDVSAFRREHAATYEYIRRYISKDGTMGYILGASEEQSGDSLMDETHLQLATETAERLWKASDTL